MKTKTCPNCSRKMILIKSQIQDLLHTDPVSYDTDWWCGCGCVERGPRMVTKEKSIYQQWEQANGIK